MQNKNLRNEVRRYHFLLTILQLSLLTIILLMRTTRNTLRSINVTSPDIILSTPPSKQRQGPPLYVQKAFLEDIEAFGGIHSGALAKVCDNKPALYGQRNSTERRQIQNKVFKWQRLSQDQLSQVKETLGLNTSLTNSISASPFPIVKCPPTPSLPPSNKESPSILPSKIKSVSKRLSFSPHIKKESLRATMPTKKFAESDGYFKMTGDERILEVQVDDKESEFHPGNLMVTRLVEMPTTHNVDKVVNGWEMTILDIDLRDFESDFYSAHQVSENQILIKVPSVPASFRKEDTFNVSDPAIKTAHGMTRAAIVGEKQETNMRSVKHMLLTFPEGEYLEAAPFLDQVTRPEDRDGELPCDCEPYDMEFKLQSGTKNHLTKKEEHFMNTGRVSWYIAIYGTERRVKLAKVVKLTPAEKLAAKLNQLDISSRGAVNTSLVVPTMHTTTPTNYNVSAMVRKIEKSITVGQQEVPTTIAAKKIDNSAVKLAAKPAPKTPPPPARAPLFRGGLELPTAPYPPDFPHHGGPKNAEKSSTHSKKAPPIITAASGATSTLHAAASGTMSNDSTGGANRTTIGTDLVHHLMDSVAEIFSVGGGGDSNTKKATAAVTSSPPVVIRNNRKIEHMFGVRDESLIIESKKKAVLNKGKESRNAQIAKKRGKP